MTLRKRRNNIQVEEAIFDATKKLIEKYGFSDLKLTQIAEDAHISHNVFYKRYPDLDELLWKFVQQYDYWFADVLSAEFDKSDLIGYYKAALGELKDALEGNKVMQELLKYELSKDNALTRRSARLRELDSARVMDDLEKYFEKSTIDIRANTALLIGGIYYLLLHKERSTFCGIDFNTEAGLERMKKAVIDTCDKMFEIRDIDNKISQIARNLLKRGVDKSIIAESTGLSLEDIALL